jgi:hypothetical protein
MPSPRDEMNNILRIAGDFAFEQISKHGDFIPFAVVLAKEGDLRFIQLGEDIVTDGGKEDLAAVRRILLAGAKKKEYRATSLVSDIRYSMADTGEITDAVRVEVEHIDDIPITCILPYRRSGTKVDQHLEPFLEPGECTVFVDNSR